jgi:peptide/nickel transport system permease protein
MSSDVAPVEPQQSTEAEIQAAAAVTTSRTSPWRKLLRDVQAVASLVVITVFVVVALVGPFLAPHGPNEAQLGMVNAPIGTDGYLLGGDESGRDIFSRLIYSSQTALIAGAIGASIALVVGVTAGLVGGYFGRRTRSVTEWVFNLIMAFPGVLLLIVLMPLTGGDYRWTMAIYGFLLAPGTYRIVRNLVLGVKNELFVDAARVAGLGNLRILGKHVLFVVRGPIIINTAFLIGSAIALQSGLAFLGVGSKEIPSFGAMIAAGFVNLYVDPLQFLWPSLALGIITAALVLLGNSLRDAFEGVKRKPAVIRAPRVVADVEGAPGTAEQDDAGRDGALLSIRDLGIAYTSPTGELREVVHGISLDIRAGETVGLVGESGSGKTQTAFAVLGVLPDEAVLTRGSVRLAGRELVGLSERELRSVRGREIAYIPQEPMSNLDPSYTIGSQLVEGVRAATGISRREARQRVLALLERVEITDPELVFRSYPHQVSGGMAQRVLIAGAVASRPKVLIADEPTTALDVTVQAEILDLLRALQEELDMAVLIVTHNFGVVADVTEKVVVMRLGEVVETSDVASIFESPKHPYTRMLIDSILDEDTERSDPPAVAGHVSQERS